MDARRRKFLKLSSVGVGSAIPPCYALSRLAQPGRTDFNERRHFDLSEAINVLRARQNHLSVRVGIWDAPFTSYDLSAIHFLVSHLDAHFDTSLEFTHLCPAAISLLAKLNSELICWGSIRELTLASAKALALWSSGRDWPFSLLLSFEQDVQFEAIAILIRENSRLYGGHSPFPTFAMPSINTALAHEIARQSLDVHIQVRSVMPSLEAARALGKFAGKSLTIDLPACPTKRWVELVTEANQRSNVYQTDLEKFEHKHALWRVAMRRTCQ